MMTISPETSPIPCPACNCGQTKQMGKLRERKGVILLNDPGNLYQCRVCGLFFRRPYHPQRDLTAQYSDLPADLWPTNKRPDFKLAVETIQRAFRYGRILDVGCYRGEFLGMLPERYQKFGVEPSKSACQISETRGITVIAPSIEDMNGCTTTFQVITLLDLIEHMTDPLGSLTKLRNLLAPEGIMILSTGNTDALPWRLMRLDYWYYFSEHVTFFNPKWFNWAAKQLNLKVFLLKTFSHFPGPLKSRLRQLALCLTFWITNSCVGIRWLSKVLERIYPFCRGKKWPEPPAARLWPDHLFVVLSSR